MMHGIDPKRKRHAYRSDDAGPIPCLIRIDGPHYKPPIPIGQVDPEREQAVEQILARIRARKEEHGR